MKLGGKSRDVESFVDQLKSEGENVITPSINNIQQIGKAPAIKSDVNGYVKFFVDMKKNHVLRLCFM